MGKLESESKKRAKRENMQKLVLGTIATTGMIGVALVAPNVLGGMEKLGIIPRRRYGQSINRARDRLIQKGCLVREQGKLRITRKGEAALRLMELAGYGYRRPARWDGKWRILIFDIPEYRKGLREKIRRTLIAVGFSRLQDSVWVYPFDCEDLIALLKADFRVGKDILYLIVDQLEGDIALKKEFELPR